METISFKLDSEMARKIEKAMKEHNYSTKTEFIRESVRDRLSYLEKQEIFRKLEQHKGIAKGKPLRMSEKKAGELAAKELAAERGIELD
jgi:Arc/MetJ-type ribon-helix-helix transcriptional regulator